MATVPYIQDIRKKIVDRVLSGPFGIRLFAVMALLERGFPPTKACGDYQVLI
jgi:hypothetical protein